MKRLVCCVKKQQDQSSCHGLEEKEESFASNISWSANETQNALSESSFVNIPNEILIHIFRLLSIRDLCNISLVCRSFKNIADDDEIWKSKCHCK